MSISQKSDGHLIVRNYFRTTLIVIAVHFLGGCGGSNGGSSEPADDSTTGNPANDSALLFTECDSTAVLSTTASTVASAPKQLNVGDVLSVSTGFGASDSLHYWSLPAVRTYRFILDLNKSIENIDDASSFTITDLDTTSVLFNGAIPFSLGADRVRYYADFTFTGNFTESSDILMQLSLPASIQDYQMGVLAASDPIPSPYFTNCPEIRSLALNTTNSISLEPGGSLGDEVWFRHNTAGNDFEFVVNTSRPDGLDGDISYEIAVLDEAAGESTAFFVYTNESNVGNARTTFNLSYPMLATNSTYPVWVRFRNATTQLNIDFTINERE